jgi:hypothetical protein
VPVHGSGYRSGGMTANAIHVKKAAKLSNYWVHLYFLLHLSWAI